MDFIIKRKILIIMLFTGLTMLGWVSYNKLSVELFPNAELPALIVQVGTPLEMDPSYIETQAIIPIEGSIGTLEGIEKIESNISSRYATIVIYYNQNADLKYANLKLQEKIDIVKNSIPEEFIINVIKIDENICNRFIPYFIHREDGAVPVAGCAEFLELFKNDPSVFVGPLPGMFHEFLPSKLPFLDPFAFQFVDNLGFCGDGGVVGAGKPQCILPVHPRTADKDILDRIVEHMTHVQHPGDVGRGDDDRERFPLVGHGMKKPMLHPVRVPFILDEGRVIFRC